jgi:hypothetical protein
MAAIVLAASSFQLTACTTTSGKQVAEPAAQEEPTTLADQRGIEVVAVRMSMAGNMVDFRYKVLDADKAGELFSKKTRPYLIHQETGKVLAVPRTAKVGPLMSSYHPKKDRIYWMFFGNQTKLVKAGDKVSVVIGDFRADNITVQ